MPHCQNLMFNFVFICSLLIIIQSYRIQMIGNPLTTTGCQDLLEAIALSDSGVTMLDLSVSGSSRTHITHSLFHHL